MISATNIKTRIEIETVRVKALERFPPATRSMMFTARDQFKPQPRKILVRLLAGAMTTDRAVALLYERMTGIPLPTR